MRAQKPAAIRQLGFEAFGVGFRIDLSDMGLEPLVRETLPPGSTASDPSSSAGRFALLETGDSTFGVQVGGSSWLENAPFHVALDTLDAHIRLYIAANAKDWVFVHAGVVACGGMALVLPGQTFSGKSTLVAALIAAGAAYCSDEYAVIDRDGRIHPYPRRVSIRDDRGGPTVERDAAELGGTVQTEAVELALVAVTRYRAASEWAPRRVSAGVGLLTLMANTVPARARPKECMAALRSALEGATVLESDRGEAGQVTTALLEELRVAASRRGSPTPIDLAAHAPRR